MFKVNQFRQIFKVFWPIALMMLLTSTLSFVDSAMIAHYNILGTSAITIATQIQSLFGPVYFALMTGVSIYTVQYFSRNETTILKKFSGIALTILMPLALINFSVLTVFPDQVIGIFQSADSQVFSLAIAYVGLYKFSILLMPFDLFFTYQYRAIKKTKIPLLMSTSEAVLNIIFNLLFIYGLGPFPELGIVGASLGTLLSRIIVLSGNILISYKLQVPFIGKITEMFSYEYDLFAKIIKNTMPLFIVEFGFGLGNVIYTKMYAMTSIIEFTAFNIAKIISFTINAFVIGVASTSGIIIGSVIAHKLVTKDKIDDTLKNLFTFMSIFALVVLFLSTLVLPQFITLFNVDQEYYRLIKILLIMNGIWMSIRIFASSLIAILKSGNDSKYVVLVDAGSTFLIGIPLTVIIFLFFSQSIVVLRAGIIIEVLTKVVLGYFRFKKGKWIKQI